MFYVIGYACKHVNACVLFVCMFTSVDEGTVCEYAQTLSLSMKTGQGSCCRHSFIKDLHSK